MLKINKLMIAIAILVLWYCIVGTGTVLTIGYWVVGVVAIHRLMVIVLRVKSGYYTR